MARELATRENYARPPALSRVALLGALALALSVFLSVGAPRAEAAQLTIAKEQTKAQIVADGARVVKNSCRLLGRGGKNGVMCRWVSAQLIDGTETRTCKGTGYLKPKGSQIEFATDRCKLDKGATSLNGLMPQKLLKQGLDSRYTFCFTTLGRGFKCVWEALRHRPTVIENCKGTARSYNGATKIKVRSCTKEPVASEAQAVVKTLLAQQGLTPELISCRPGTAIDCTYEASRSSGGWKYSCTGTATAPSPAGPFDLSRCELGAPKLAPLTPTPGPHPLFGVNEGWRQMLPQLDRLSGDFGAETARFQVSWTAVQRQPGEPFDWSFYDPTYAQMQRHGIDPVIFIMGAPCWATGDPQCTDTDYTYPPDAGHLEDWGRFAAAVARHYPDAMAIEVWNEANARLFFHGGPQPTRYATLLKEAYTSIKAVDPKMPVITTGTAAFVANDANRMRYDDFLRAVYEALGFDAREYSDGIGHHAYPGGGPQADIETGVRGQIADLRDVMLDFGDQDKPIWVTETGVSTAGQDPYTEAEQAKAYSQLYEQFRRIPGIPVVIEHRWRDLTGSKRNPETGFGLTRADGSRKPVYCSLAAARGHSLPDKSCK